MKQKLICEVVDLCQSTTVCAHSVPHTEKDTCYTKNGTCVRGGVNGAFCVPCEDGNIDVATVGEVVIVAASMLLLVIGAIGLATLAGAHWPELTAAGRTVGEWAMRQWTSMPW